MNLNAVVREYGQLTPKERFRLIVAAGGRGDESEQQRLLRVSQRIQVSVLDHAPYSHAFGETAQTTYVELLALSASYLETFQLCEVDQDLADMDDEVDEQEDDQVANDPTSRQRSFHLALALGFVLRIKSDGWQLFCERLGIPPWVYWESFPGFERVQRAVALAARAAFVEKGFCRWLNKVQPDAAELNGHILTADDVADVTEQFFRERVKWWGG